MCGRTIGEDGCRGSGVGGVDGGVGKTEGFVGVEYLPWVSVSGLVEIGGVLACASADAHSGISEIDLLPVESG